MYNLDLTMMYSRKVAILGSDADFDTLIHMVAACGLQPAMICPGAGAVPVSGGSVTLDAARVNEYARILGTHPCAAPLDIRTAQNEELHHQPDLPVLIGSYGARERNYFRETLLYARNKLGLANHLVHPSALCDLVKLTVPRYLITAFPGSGNMLVQNLVAKVLAYRQAPAGEPISGQLSHYALSYHFSLAEKIASAFDEVGRIGDVQGPSHIAFGGTYISTKDGEGPTVLAGLPMRAYTWANPWTSSHEPLSRVAMEFFGSQNVRIIQILRHPLDIMVSNAAKITSFAGHRCPQYLLNDRSWVQDMVALLEIYAEGISEHGRECFTIRYEDILEKPVESIQKLASYLGVNLDIGSRRVIWSEIVGKPLSSDPGHLWDPGYGKWRDYVPPKMAELVGSPALRTVWQSIGYDVAPSALTGAKSAVPPEAERLDHLQVVWQDSRWEASCGKRSSFRSEGVRVTRRNGLLGVTRSEFDPIMQGVIDSSLLKDMLASAYFDESFVPCAAVLSSYCDGLRGR